MRNPTETVQINLRIKERERAQLAAAAEANGVSLNAEMAARLARTFRQTREWGADQLAENVNRFLAPVAADVHELQRRGDLVRVADIMSALLADLLPADGPLRDEIEEAISRYKKIRSMLEGDIGRRILKTSTDPGAQS
jgi:hypothetical protein